jgi:streptothricin acetyltransferase
MNLTIQKVNQTTLPQVYACDSSFTVTSKLQLNATDGVITYTVIAVSPYEKQYPHEVGEYGSYINQPDSAIFLAYVDEQIAGRVVLRKYWNGYGYVEDIAVNPPYRKQGVGQRLLQQAVAWVKEKGLPGLMLETQNNNVPACRFYERFGFKLGGLDTELYKGLMPETDEVAMYWYLRL